MQESTLHIRKLLLRWSKEEIVDLLLHTSPKDDTAQIFFCFGGAYALLRRAAESQCTNTYLKEEILKFLAYVQENLKMPS